MAGAINIGTLEAVLKLRDELSPAMGKLIGMVGGMLSVGAAIGAINKALMAQSEAEAAINKLNLALANQGIYSAQTSKALQDYASALQDVSVFDDEAILGAEAMLVSFGLNEEQIRRTTQAAADFASATGMDLQSAIRAVTMGVEGQGRAFKAYGIEVEDTGSRSKNLDNILSQLEQKFGGSAQLATQTYAGSMKQLSNATGDAWEAAGKFFGFLTSSGDKPFQGLINGAKSLQKFFGHDLIIAFSELQARFAEMVAYLFEKLATLYEFLGKLPGFMGGDEFKKYAQTFRDIAAGQKDLAKEQRAAADAAASQAGNLQKVENQARPTIDRMNELTAVGRKATESAEKHATELKRLEYALDGMAFQIQQAQKELGIYDEVTIKVTWSVTDMTKALNAAALALEVMPEGVATDLEAIAGALNVARNELRQMSAEASWGHQMFTTLTESLQSLPGIIVGAIQGGGDVFMAIGAKLGGDIGSKMAEMWGPALSNKLGATLGGLLTGAFGPVLGLIGSWIGDKIGGWFGDLFGGKSEVSKARDAFFDRWEDGFIGVQRALLGTLGEVGQEDWVKELFDAKSVEELNAVIAKIREAILALGQNVPPIVIPIVYDDPGAPGGGGVPGEGAPGFASGTTWRDFGPGTLTMLHGVERVQTPAQARAETQVTGGADVLNELRGLRRDLLDFPQITSRAVRDAMAFRT